MYSCGIVGDNVASTRKLVSVSAMKNAMHTIARLSFQSVALSSVPCDA